MPSLTPRADAVREQMDKMRAEYARRREDPVDYIDDRAMDMHVALAESVVLPVADMLDRNIPEEAVSVIVAKNMASVLLTMTRLLGTGDHGLMVLVIGIQMEAAMLKKRGPDLSSDIKTEERT